MKKKVAHVKTIVVHNYVLPETILMMVLCTFDTLYTLVCVRAGLAEETNPILRDALAKSDFAFLAVKMTSYLVPLIVLEFVRHHHPRFVEKAMRFGFMAYALAYFGGSVMLVLLKLYR